MKKYSTVPKIDDFWHCWTINLFSALLNDPLWAAQQRRSIKVSKIILLFNSAENHQLSTFSFSALFYFGLLYCSVEKVENKRVDLKASKYPSFSKRVKLCIVLLQTHLKPGNVIFGSSEGPKCRKVPKDSILVRVENRRFLKLGNENAKKDPFSFK